MATQEFDFSAAISAFHKLLCRELQKKLRTVPDDRQKQFKLGLKGMMISWMRGYLDPEDVPRN
jgi:hypothetical protein